MFLQGLNWGVVGSKKKRSHIPEGVTPVGILGVIVAGSTHALADGLRREESALQQLEVCLELESPALQLLLDYFGRVETLRESLELGNTFVGSRARVFTQILSYKKVFR